MRSFLFAPGDNDKLREKAFTAGADAVVLDLEDAVPTHRKSYARSAVADTLHHHAGWVRINTAGTDAAALDLQFVASLAAGLRIPKVETIRDVQWVSDRAPGVPLICAIESAAGLVNVHEIARHPRVQRLSMGGLDLRTSLGLPAGSPTLSHARSELVIASSAAGIEPPLDSVYPELGNQSGLSAEATVAHSHGFTGKSAIHPNQLPVIHKVFSPTEKELVWAGSVVAAFMAADRGPTTLSTGEFVDKPVADRAAAILRRAGQLEVT